MALTGHILVSLSLSAMGLRLFYLTNFCNSSRLTRAMLTWPSLAECVCSLEKCICSRAEFKFKRSFGNKNWWLKWLQIWNLCEYWWLKITKGNYLKMQGMLSFLCAALLNEIYPPMKFQVDISKVFLVMLWTNIKHEK
jgi:hypothetical protein